MSFSHRGTETQSKAQKQFTAEDAEENRAKDSLINEFNEF